MTLKQCQVVETNKSTRSLLSVKNIHVYIRTEIEELMPYHASLPKLNFGDRQSKEEKSP